jgi:hypothetical protein
MFPYTPRFLNPEIFPPEILQVAIEITDQDVWGHQWILCSPTRAGRALAALLDPDAPTDEHGWRRVAHTREVDQRLRGLIELFVDLRWCAPELMQLTFLEAAAT